MSIRLRCFALPTIAVVLLAAVVCGLPARAQDTGDADFTKFVTLGDSLGAAFASGSLIRTVQDTSVPVLIARQTTGQQIEQPLVSEPGIPAILHIQNLSPVVITPVPGFGRPLNAGLARPYDNLSVPGFRLGEALRNRDRPNNSFAQLVLRVPATMLEQALSLRPTFALVWLGSNDVLAAAVAGVVIEGATITPVAQFQSDYVALVGALKASGVDLALATVPDVTSIPFVTTIPPVLVDRVTNQPILGPNGQPISLLGPNGPLGLNDHVLLRVSPKLAQGIGIPTAVGGTGIPLSDEDVLSAAEAAVIQARVDAFNNVIRAVAVQSGSALADINGLLRRAAGAGFNIGGINFTADFLSGGMFSLDGVHPAPLGYAVVANEFIRAINATYDANIEPVDLFPFLFGEDAFPIPLSAASNFIFTEEASRQVEEVFGVGQSSGSGGPKKPAKRVDGPWKLPTRPRG
jgi:lysophospholipase L1-like esterase